MDDLECLRSHWGHRQWIIVGHSFGATIGLACAWRNPDSVAALVYLSGTGIGDWQDDFLKARERRLTGPERCRHAQLSGMPARSLSEDQEMSQLRAVAEFVHRRDAVAWVSAETAAHVNRAARSALIHEVDSWTASDVRKACGELRMPIIAVRGCADPRPPAAVQRLVSTVRHGALVSIPGAGHFPWVEEPGRVAAILRSVVTRYGNQSARADHHE